MAAHPASGGAASTVLVIFGYSGVGDKDIIYSALNQTEEDD